MGSVTSNDRYIAELQATIAAQQKTIETLMDTVERSAADGESSLALFSENLNLERVVQRKTEHLRRQGKKLAEALRDLQMTQAQLVQASKLESVGRLAAGIAHEINTPVQFIATNVGFLLEAFDDIAELMASVCPLLDKLQGQGATDVDIQAVGDRLEELDWDYLKDEIPDSLRQSEEGLERISGIVLALKEFSHPSGKAKERADLNRIIRTTVVMARNEWKYCADVVEDLAPDLPWIYCLRDELGQVILNLLVNSAHAIEERREKEGNQEKGLITLKTVKADQQVEFRITDNGCGIASEIQKNVFEPFFTTKTVGRGTGQGLAITHDVIVKKHGGELSFTSEEGQGCEFIIRLPLKPPSPAGYPQKEGAE